MKKVVNSLFGYRDPKPNEDFTDVIYTKEEYDDNIKKISDLEREIKSLKIDYDRRIEAYKNSANDKIAEIRTQADGRVAEAQAERDKHKSRADSFENINKNLIRIATERANVQRGLSPKKQHIGYLFLSIEEFIFNCECSISDSSKSKTLKFPCFRLRLQSPYQVSFDLDSVKDLIYDDLLKKLCQKMGIVNVYKKGIVGYTENVVNEVWNREGNFIFKIVCKANFQKGFWEVEFLTRDMVIIPPDMMIKK